MYNVRTMSVRRLALVALVLFMATAGSAFALVAVSWGQAGDVPVARDYDGDGDTDVTVFRPSEGGWYTQGTPPFPQLWGQAGDVPVPGDYDGDGDTDIAVFRNGHWYVRGQPPYPQFWGTSGDVPVPGDYDGDGDTDLAVFRGGEWYVRGQPPFPQLWGQAGDVPVPADYDGDGDTDIAVFRAGHWYVKDQPPYPRIWGRAGDVPVPGHYDADNDADLAVFREGTQFGEWYVQGQPLKLWGAPTDVPVPGDYDGDGHTDITVFSPGSGSWWMVRDPVIAAAGDLCSTATDCAPTAALVDTIDPHRVLVLGDNAYPNGSTSDYASFYHPNWGRFKAKTNPVPGNHEYQTSGAAGYFGYFTGVQPYYSFDLGAWHVVAINSEIAVGAGSAQELWLKADLAANAGKCILAYWHQPRWSSSTTHGSNAAYHQLWLDLYAAGADIVLNGHVHNYERFAKQSPTGAADPEGIREFVVGTGGRASFYAFGTPLARSEVRNTGTHGVLELTLHTSSYDWRFVPVAGKTFTDSGSDSC